MTLQLSVIGTNYLGATHAAGMAEFGHHVIGVDIDVDRVKTLNSGQSHIFEVGLEPLLEKHTSSGRLRFTTDYAEIADWADVHFLALGTPSGPGGAADLSQLHAAIDTLAPLLTKPCLVVGKSTVPVGTALQLEQRLRSRAPAGDRIEVAWNPEFLREAYAVQDTLRPDRLVFGTHSAQGAGTAGGDLLDSVDREHPGGAVRHRHRRVDQGRGELVPGDQDQLHQCDGCRCARRRVVTSPCWPTRIGYDRRIGREFLNAGLGFGGGCLPKDIQALAVRADELGVHVLSDLIRSVEAINDGQRAGMADLAIDQAGGDVKGKRIAVLGAAFKPGTNDTRNSPALTVADRLHAAGADVRIYDPQARLPPREGFTQVASVDQALLGADIVLHLTEWPEFRQLDPEKLGELVKTKIIIDGRLKLDARSWHRAGWKVVQIGRATTL